MNFFRIGITHGDINGISYEMLLKVLQDPEMLEFFTPVIFGSLQVARATTACIGVNMIPFTIVRDASEAIDGRINIVPVCADSEPELQFGKQTEAALQAEASSLTAALGAYSNGDIDALVTLPGHLDNDETSHALTDFIRRALNIQESSFDWIINDKLRALLLHPLDVTTELGEGLASEALRADLQAISNSLRLDFDMIRPRIAVVTAQAKVKNDLEELHEKGVLAFGPLAADAFLQGEWYNHYDGCLFLGEDDAYRKLVASQNADLNVGYISGLPLVLTYPVTGIRYDIAGTGQASEVPLRQSLYAAIDILRHRIRYRHATHHPLQKYWVPRGRDDYKLDLTKDE